MTPTDWEPRPDNFAANHRVPAGSVPWSDASSQTFWTKWIAKRNRVTGNYTGATTEIVQWAACKWGVDEDTIRAVAVRESQWHQSTVGDNCGGDRATFGITQIKNKYCDGSLAWGGYPDTQNETALDVDFYAAYIRSCYDGDFYDGAYWLYRGQTVQQVAAAHGWSYVFWGCVGSWFSGQWYDADATTYIGLVKQYLADRTWLQY